MSETPHSSVRLFLINVVSSAATRILQLTVLVWVNQYLLRRIEPEEYSLYPVVMSLVVFADFFRNIFTGGLGRYMVEADSRGDDDGMTRIVSSMLPFLATAALFFATVGGIAAWQIEKILDIAPAYLSDARLMLVFLVMLVSLNIITAPFAQGLYVRQRFVALNVIDLGCEALRMTLLFVLLLGISTKVLWLVVASTCAGIVGLFLRIRATRRLLPAAQFRRKQVSVGTAWTLMGFGAWTSIQGITGLVENTAPALILNRFGTALDVATFHLGRLPDTQLRRVTAAAAVPLQPLLTSIYARKGEGSLNDLYYRGGRYHLWVTLIVVAPLLVFGKEIIDLYVGSKYAEAPIVIFALLVVYPFVWASAMFYRVAHAIGKIRVYSICELLVQGVTLGALFYAVAIRGLGAPGAAVAIALASGTLHLLLIWPIGLRLVNGRWSRFVRQTLLPGVIPFASAIVVCYWFGTAVTLNSWFRIGLGCAVAFGVYVTVMLVFCLDSVDRQLFTRMTGRIRGALRQAVASFGSKPVGNMKRLL